MIKELFRIQLLESPIPAAPAAAPAPPSQKASSDDISGTKRGTVDPLVSKRLEKIPKKKIQKKKNVENGQKWSKMVKMVKMVLNGQKGFKMYKMVKNGRNGQKLPKMV